MRRVSFPLPGLLAATLLLPAAARGQAIMADIRADRWAEAAQEAAADPDPVAAKLVTFYRLLAPGQASAGRDRPLHRRQPRLAVAGHARPPPRRGAGDRAG